MSSETRNSAWRKLSDILGILDPRGISKRVSTDPIIPVVGLDLGMLNYETVFCSTTLATTALTTSIFFPILGDVYTSVPNGINRFPFSAEKETLILGWTLSAEIVGAGDPSNLHWVDVYREYGFDPLVFPTTAQLSKLERWGYFDFAGGKTKVVTSYGPAQQRSDGTVISTHGPDRPIWIPAGKGFCVRMEVNPLANFAIGTTVYAQAWGVQFPKGARGPWL